MQYTKFSELLGFQHRKFSSNHLNFAPNSILLNEKAHLEIITPWFNTGEKRLSLPLPIVLHHSSYAKCYLIQFLKQPRWLWYMYIFVFTDFDLVMKNIVH